MMDRGKGNEIMSGVRADDEVSGGLEADGGAKIADREGDSATEVDIARVPQESDAGVSLVLDDCVETLRRHVPFIGAREGGGLVAHERRGVTPRGRLRRVARGRLRRAPAGECTRVRRGPQQRTCDEDKQ
ncbi:hypothetical protein BHE74_00039006 [Ensete ventricosum]|nr:hypothetical protein BHE74_00039006 [Ensete ventricosum]